jgi:broad specificity phosphatase PhoE
MALGTRSGFRFSAFHRGGQRLTFEYANVNVFAIRHGETEWSFSGKHTGATDIPLTDHGRRLAERMRPVLARNFSGLALCSPMQRAQETCELAGFGQNMVVDPDLAEWNYGEYEGKTPPEIHGALDRTTPQWGSALSAGYWHVMRPQLLP